MTGSLIHSLSIWIAGLCAVVLLLNLLVAGVTAAWHSLWCRSVKWTADGLMPSAPPLDAGDGETAILFVHGFNDVPYVWKRFVETLSVQGFNCRAMRLPGAGERDARTSLAAMRAAVDAALGDLRVSHRRVVLAGHSLGGALALDAVLRRNGSAAQRPDGLVLLAPLIEVSRARSPLLPAHAWYLVLRFLVPALRWVPSVFKEYLHAEDDAAFVYRRDRFNEIGWYRSLFALVAELRGRDRSPLDVPTLVFAAGADRVVDSDATARWFAGRAAVEFHVVADASHVLPLNPRWREFAERIRTFAAGSVR